MVLECKFSSSGQESRDPGDLESVLQRALVSNRGLLQFIESKPYRTLSPVPACESCEPREKIKIV